LVVAAVAVLLVVYFDLQSNFPYVDEYARRWSLEHFVDGHGLVSLGFSTDIPESVLALPAALLHWEPRFWRLAGIPFVVVSGVFSFVIAQRLGASRFWSAMSAALVIAGPVSLFLATGMMTETGYIGLLMAALWASICWVTDGKRIGWVVVLLVLCTLQREQGVTIAPLVTLGLLLNGRSRPLRRVDVLGLALLWVAALLTYEALVRFQGAGIGQVYVRSGTAANHVRDVIFAVTAVPILAGFFLLPFLVALLGGRERRARDSRWEGAIEMVAVVVALIGIVWAALAARFQFYKWFVGDIWTPLGLGPISVGGVKPVVLPFWLFLSVALLSLLTTAVLLIVRRTSWRPSNLGLGGGLLVIAALLQFAVIPLHGDVFDRYYVLVFAPLIPLLAVLATRAGAGTAAKAWALGALTAGVLFFAVGEQDYQAWQTALDKTANLAYASYAVDDVNAGWEEYSVHVHLPAVDDRTGLLPTQIREHPSAVLEFASTNDRRLGFTYNSIAPGKVVIKVNPSPTP
jgi:hypothetical protein